MSLSVSLILKASLCRGNYGFPGAGVDSDPGFYADWNFIDHLTTQGDGICPAPAVYTDPHGTIRDDERSGDADSSDEDLL